MLVIPQYRAILIFPPRTGGTSLLNAVRETYDASFLLYRHAEADCVPRGYEEFRKVGFVRNPLARMWSLFKFLATLDPLNTADWARESAMQLLESVQGKSFESWLLDNKHWFLPPDTGNPGLFQQWPMPETVKSQFCYLRPDLGTDVIPLPRLEETMTKWGLPKRRDNHTPGGDVPKMTPAMREHFEAHMPWELDMDLPPV